MTGVIYARYSSDSQREESIEGQLRECMAYAERSGITIIGNYIDRAMSARTADRPDFQRMINDSEKHLFDVILVWKLDRFSRDRYDSATYKHILKKNGVKVISATENISDSPEGILLESLLEGLSEYYSAELSVKIQRGQMENAMKGKNNGGTVPLGLRKGPDGVLEIDPITAPIVQEIFQRYDKGESMTDIVASLNERGIRTAKGLPFRIGSLGTVLKNRKYIGEYRYGKIVIPDKLPVIIDVELFDRVQRRMEVNRHAPARAKADEEYLLTTKLFCGHCGRMLAGESGRSRNGEVHYYYKCGGAKRKQGCTLKAVKKRWIERTVVTATITRVLHNDVIGRIADALVAYQNKESTLLPSLKQQLRECEKSIQNMLNAIEAGIITPSTKQRLQDLEARCEELNVSILQEQLQKPRFTKEQIVTWISRFKYGDPDDLEYQKQIIDTFVNSVYVYDDRLVMTYNYKDGTETISLDAVHQAFGSDLSSDAPLYLENATVSTKGAVALCYYQEEGYMTVVLEALESEVKRCSDGILTKQYRSMLDALDDQTLTQELVDYLCKMIVAKKYFWEIHFDHLRPLLLNPTAVNFDLKAFYAERFNRSRRLCMKMYFMRGYAIYASEQETALMCEKFERALRKGHDYIDYMDIMSEYGLAYLVRTYNYPCFVDAWDIAQREYEKINPLLRGYTTTDARLRHVNLLSTGEVWKRQMQFIAELREKNDS